MVRFLLVCAATVLLPGSQPLFGLPESPRAESPRLDAAVRVSQDVPRVLRLRAQAKKAIEARQGQRALALVRQAWRLAPGSTKTRELYATAVLSVGSELFDQKEIARARDVFREGISIHDENAALYLGFGQASRELRQSGEAGRAFARAIEIDPKFVPALIAQGSLQYELRQYDLARKHLTRAVQLDPDNTLAKTLLQRSLDDGAVERGFKRHSNSHFVLSYHGGRRGLERFQPEILEYLEECYANMTKILRRKPKNKIRVLLYTKTEFKTLNRNADWVQAYYDGKVRIPLDSWQGNRGRVRATIRHELVHAFVQELYGTITAWLHEGFAQRIEGLEDKTVLRQLEGHALIAAKPLRRSFVLERNPARARRLYAQSFLLFQEIERRLGSRGIAPLFERIRKGEGSLPEREDKALKSLLGVNLERLIAGVAHRRGLTPPGKKPSRRAKPGR